MKKNKNNRDSKPNGECRWFKKKQKKDKEIIKQLMI